jgi:uncharacterized membrane protein YecN with MAPEG domain
MPAVALPVVSALTAGVAVIVQMVLMLLTAGQRRRARQSLGDGEDDRLLRAVRRHGNFAENAAIFLVCLALVEMMGAGRIWVGGLAALFLLGRALHVIGLSMKRTVNVWRMAGVSATAFAGVALGVQLISLAVGQLGG